MASVLLPPKQGQVFLPLGTQPLGCPTGALQPDPKPPATQRPPWAGSLEHGGSHNPSPCSGGHGGHTGETSRGGPSVPCKMVQRPGGTHMGTWGGGGAWQRKDGVLPGSIEAVVRADRVVPEELLAAVCTSLCTEMEEKHRLEKSGSLDAGTTRGWPGLSSV